MASPGLWWQVIKAALLSRSNQQFYDRIAPVYDKVYVQHRLHADNMTDLLATTFAGREGVTRVLDLGCGTGILARLLAERGFAVAGVDISRASLQVLQQAGPTVAAVQGEGAQLPFAEGTFQAVVSLGAWRHFPDAEAVMRDVVRVLDGEGCLLIGYFPPALGGALRLGRGAGSRVLACLYGFVIRRLGYVDHADLSLEPQTLSLAGLYFDVVDTLISGEHWHLIMARRCRISDRDE